MKISLDLESVLAASLERYIEVYNERHGTNWRKDDIDYWGWMNEYTDYDEFMEILETEWRENPLEIPPCEEAIAEAVEQLSQHHEVHIVTATPAPRAAVEEWLSHHGVTHHHELRVVGPEFDKAELDYDAYIDDKPTLAENLTNEQIQYLVEHPHNESHRDHDRTISVASIHHAIEDLLDGHIAAD